MWLASQPYLLRETEDGQRLVSWRMWVLVWLLPVAFALATVALVIEAAWKQLATVPGQGEVVRVYEWEGDTIFDRGRTNFGPVFRYTWSDGNKTEASTDMSHPDWNFPIGSNHQIRYFPGFKSDVLLPGAHNWMVAVWIAGISAVLAVPAWFADRRLRRWQRQGAHV